MLIRTYVQYIRMSIQYTDWGWYGLDSSICMQASATPDHLASIHVSSLLTHCTWSFQTQNNAWRLVHWTYYRSPLSHKLKTSLTRPSHLDTYRIKCTVFSLGCFWGVLHPPIVQKYPPISVSEAAAPPIRMMACKADLYSILLPNSYTHASAAIDCTIVTLAEDRGWIRD